jgi:hypothetical protein
MPGGAAMVADAVPTFPTLFDLDYHCADEHVAVFRDSLSVENTNIANQERRRRSNLACGDFTATSEDHHH